MKALLLALALLYAAQPPSLCACRLQALLLPVCQDDDDDDSDPTQTCHCVGVKHVSALSAPPSVEKTAGPSVALVADVYTPFHGDAFRPAAASPFPSRSQAALYGTLRALLI